jgi:SnoaL-like domain
MDPEIEYVNPAGAVEPGTRRGLAGFKRAIDKVFEGWETWDMEAERFRAVGDQVAVVVRYRARGRASGVEVEGRESARHHRRGRSAGRARPPDRGRGDCGRRLPPLALEAPRRTLPTASPQPVTWRGPSPSPSWP